MKPPLRIRGTFHPMSGKGQSYGIDLLVTEDSDEKKPEKTAAAMVARHPAWDALLSADDAATGFARIGRALDRMRLRLERDETNEL